VHALLTSAYRYIIVKFSWKTVIVRTWRFNVCVCAFEASTLSVSETGFYHVCILVASADRQTDSDDRQTAPQHPWRALFHYGGYDGPPTCLRGSITSPCSLVWQASQQKINVLHCTRSMINRLRVVKRCGLRADRSADRIKQGKGGGSYYRCIVSANDVLLTGLLSEKTWIILQ